jgi:HEPN domain-containing protein
MTAPDRAEEVRRWLRYAHEDLTTAELLSRTPEAIPRHVCFLAQQAAEKALKAVLVFLDNDVPLTHNLDILRDTISEAWQLKEDHPDLVNLSFWAVEARYPTELPDPTPEDASVAVQQARAVWESVVRDMERAGFRFEDG